MKRLSATILPAITGSLIAIAPAGADPTPECNSGAPTDSTECGADAAAGGVGATAFGDTATAAADQTTAAGNLADASALGAQAFGYDADATGQLSLAVGHLSDATNTRATALGTRANASGLHATALGTLTNAAGQGAVAVGNGASASNAGSTAMGVLTVSSADFATAVGRRANASAINASAIGADSVATHAGSTSLGFGATSTTANQVTLGGTGSQVRVGDIGASTAAQNASSVGLATVDANGVLGRNTTLLPQLDSMQAVVFDLADQVGTMRRDIRNANEGVAMALALDSPSIPAGAKFALSGGIGNFKGALPSHSRLRRRLARWQAYRPASAMVSAARMWVRAPGSRLRGEFRIRRKPDMVRSPERCDRTRI